MKYAVAFVTQQYCIDGESALALVVRAEDAESAGVAASVEVTLTSTNGVYTQVWSALRFASGQTSIPLSFVVPMEWANDATTLDAQGNHGRLQVTLSVTQQVTVAQAESTVTYEGYYDSVPVTVVESVVPSVGTVQYTVVDDVVPSDWGCLVQGHSVVRISAVQAVGAYGAEICRYRFDGGLAQTEPYAEIRLNRAGDIGISVVVEDTRGRVAQGAISLVVQPYKMPTLTHCVTARCGANGDLAQDGTYFLAGGEVTRSVIGARNDITLSVAWKEESAQIYGDAVVLSDLSGSVVDANLVVGVSYDVKYTLQDQFYQIAFYDKLYGVPCLVHLLKGGTGLAIGKEATQANLLDVALDATLRQNLTVCGETNLAGNICLNGVSVQEILSSLCTPQGSVFSLENTVLSQSDVNENKIVRMGRQLFYALQVEVDSGQNFTVGQSVVVAQIPSGYYHEDEAFLLQGWLNETVPCVVNVSQEGEVSVIVRESTVQSIRVMGVGVEGITA